MPHPDGNSLGSSSFLPIRVSGTLTKDLGDIWTNIYQWQGTFTWEWERPRKACGWQNCGMGAAYSSPHHNSKQCTHCLKSHLPAELVKSLAACLTKGKCLYPLQLLFFHCPGRCFSTWPCQGATWGLCEDAHSNLVGRGGAWDSASPTTSQVAQLLLFQWLHLE